MASPSPDAIAAIRAHVTDWTPDNPAIVEALNAPSVANPAPQANVGKPYTVLNLLGSIDPTRRAGLTPLLAAIRPDFDAQDGTAIVGWSMALMLTGDLMQSDVDGITAVVSATEPDPSYQAQIGWALATLGRPVDLLDVIAARPQGS